MVDRNDLKHAHRIGIGITILVLLSVSLEIVRADIGLPDTFQIPGRIEANGVHFEINNSQYLNITLDSSEPVKVILESVPKMVSIYIQSISGADSTQIILSGFIPLTTYNKYEDNYHNLVAFTTDPNGQYIYTQDLSSPHLIFIQPAPRSKSIGSNVLASSSHVGPYFIQDDATGGDCTLIGLWDSISKTCTLTDNLMGTIQIDSDGITFDGNSYSILYDENYNGGVYLLGRTGVMIKNLEIDYYGIGISLYSSSNNNLIGNKLNSVPISLLNSHNNNLIRNRVNYPYNIGIELSSSNNNNLIGNEASVGVGIGIYLYSSNINNLEGNYGFSHGDIGIMLSSSSYNNLTGNSGFSDFGRGIIISSSNYNNLIGNWAGYSLFEAGHEGIVLGGSNNNNLIGNSVAMMDNGISLYSSSNNNLESNSVQANYYGIYLDGSNNNNITGNSAEIQYWIYQGAVIYIGGSNNNLIYNNYFNYPENFGFVGSIQGNDWNTTKLYATNIIGGSYFGGNFWTQPDGNGYSQKCIDSEPDGICDSPYELNANNIDYLPLSLEFPSELIEPNTIIELTGVNGNNNWYTSNVRVTLTATDNEGGSGVARTEYKIDDGATWNQYSVPFTVSNDIEATISYRSTDRAGNIEQIKTEEIKICKTTPSITISSPQTKDYLQTESLLLNFGASDTMSGVDSITSSLDSIPVTNGQLIDLSTLTLGQHTLTINAIDKAGNSARNSVTFNLIQIVPAIVDVKPDTLNKASQGGAVTAYIYIELPGFDVSEIDVSTVKLGTNNGMVSALLSPTEVGDYDNDGIPDLMVKFDRQEVIGIVDIGDVVVTISGKISGEDFEGSDVIRVIDQAEPKSEQIPEFPTIALPVIVVIGLISLFHRRQGK